MSDEEEFCHGPSAALAAARFGRDDHVFMSEREDAGFACGSWEGA